MYTHVDTQDTHMHTYINTNTHAHTFISEEQNKVQQTDFSTVKLDLNNLDTEILWSLE